VLLRIEVLRSLVRSPPHELREKVCESNSRVMVYFFFAGCDKSTTFKPGKRGIVTRSPGTTTSAHRRTWRKTLLELLSLFWVVDGEGVKISRAPNFELGLSLAGGRFCSDLLYPGLCR
jgi:hypothetical protein